MKLAGDAVLHAEPERVYAALTDPAVLVRAIPGCEALEALGDDAYRLSVTAGVASVRGRYDGEVRLSDQDPPHALVLRATGAGAPGTVDATVRVSLTASDDGTLLAYAADAVVGGMVGGVGQRMLTSAARKLAGDFFAVVDGVLTGAPASTAQRATSVAAQGTVVDEVPAAVPGTVFRAPVPLRPTASTGSLVVAALAGAALALIGVAVGWRLRRR